MMEQRTQRHDVDHQGLIDKVEPDDLNQTAGPVGSDHEHLGWVSVGIEIHDHNGVLDNMTDRCLVESVLERRTMEPHTTIIVIRNTFECNHYPPDAGVHEQGTPDTCPIRKRSCPRHDNIRRHVSVLQARSDVPFSRRVHAFRQRAFPSACHMGYHMVMARREVLVQLDDDLVEQLDALAADLGTNRSELMRRGAQAVLDAERLAAADRELRAAYRRQPADPTLVQSARRLAAETAPEW